MLLVFTLSANICKADDDYFECGVCSGSGQTTCLLCMGAGGRQEWRCLTYPPYSQYYEYVPCMACRGKGIVVCMWCSGSGEVKKVKPANRNSNSYNGRGYSGGSSKNYNNGSSGSKRSSGRTCPGCNGSGKGPDQITYSPNYTGGDNSRYCSTCGRTMSAHTHHRPMCRTCYGKGRIE